MPTDSRVVALADAPADLGVEVIPSGRIHGDVPGERLEQRDVLVGCVETVPDVAPDLDVLEQAGPLDLLAIVRHLLGRWRRPVAFPLLADLVVRELTAG